MILVTGALGQIGHGLVPALQRAWGKDRVLATDIRASDEQMRVDVLDLEALRVFAAKYRPVEIYHLAAALSATAETHPYLAWRINVEGLWNILQVAKEYGIHKVFWASSIAVFGPSSRPTAPQIGYLDPVGLYGIAKLAGEKLCAYFYHKQGLDVRAIRFPGVISPDFLPTGGTTDYAVHMVYYAIEKGRYTSYLSPDLTLPMIYIDDVVRAIQLLMQAPREKLRIHEAYNIQAFSLSPSMLCEEIRAYVPHFVCEYKPDFREMLARSWPEQVEDSYARSDWGWQPSYDLSQTVRMVYSYIKQTYYGSA
ncbi:MAG: NAD-dependent epimerase/dehydratase family protein [Bacteroidia bacterium]